MYAMVVSRPDIAYTVGALARHVQNPQKEHWNAVWHLLRYLNTTKALGITYQGISTSGPKDIEVIGMSDSDWAGNRETRRSTSSYVFTLNGAAITWSSRLQKTVALSSMEAEYMGGCAAAKEAVWIRQILADSSIFLLGENTESEKLPTTPIYMDNQAAISLSKNPDFREKAKHIEIQYHYLRQQVERDIISITYLPTTEMTADIMTKGLNRILHQKHVAGMGMRGASRGD